MLRSRGGQSLHRHPGTTGRASASRSRFGMTTGDRANSVLSPAAIAALHRGEKIEAIRITREERNIGLKEAKDAVDEYVRSQPALRSALAEAQGRGTRTVLTWLVVVIVIVVVAYRLLGKG